VPPGLQFTLGPGQKFPKGNFGELGIIPLEEEKLMSADG